MVELTTQDLHLTKKNIIEPRIKIDIYTYENKHLDTIQGGLIQGSLSIAADSDVRRTINASFNPNRQFNIKIVEGNYLWLDKYVVLYIGFHNTVKDEDVWYIQGKYVFTDSSITYDATNNQVQINASDLVAKLNDTVNGALGQQIIEYPAYEQNEETGEPIKYNLIRDAVITTATQLGRINPNDVFVDDVGEYKGMPLKNPNWEQYRKETPLWNSIPYDLSFSAGCSVWSIIQELIGLYPDYEAFFDENANFRVQMIPDCNDDDTYFESDHKRLDDLVKKYHSEFDKLSNEEIISLKEQIANERAKSGTNGFLNEILISENNSLDFSAVRNITEVWGEAIGDVEFFAQSGVGYTDNIYSAKIDGYNEKYFNGDLIALKIPTTNEEGCRVNINNFGVINVYDENTELPLPAERMEANQTYVFKIKKKRNIEASVDEIRCYLLGQWQPHAICVLTDGTVGDDYITTGGKTVKRYSKEFFQEVYNCETVGFTVIPDSPFTIQKLGERLAVFTGGEFDNIQSDSLAMARAEWELFKTARLTDNLSITVKYMPYMDVNIKVQYQGYNDDVPQKFIVKSVTHDFQNGTTALTLMRWYPLYLPEDYPDLIE